MRRSCRLTGSILLLIIVVLSLQSFCVWSSLPSGGEECENESCGWGCTVVGYGPNVTECYTGGYPSPFCCICTWYVVYCNCTFGPGTGMVASAGYVLGYICTVEGEEPPYEYSCQPEL